MGSKFSFKPRISERGWNLERGTLNLRNPRNLAEPRRPHAGAHSTRPEEREGAAEAYDCKWGARGINADVLYQLDDARTQAADEDERLAVALVVFDAARSCAVRLAAQTAPHDGTAIVTIETLDALARPA